MSDRAWQIEMLWRCSVCSAENKGRDKTCSNCTAPKKETDEFYMPGDTSFGSRVTDEKQISNAKAGPDWSCRFCGSAQQRNDGECAQCGVDQAEGMRKSSPTIVPPPVARSLPPSEYPARVREVNRSSLTVDRDPKKVEPWHVLIAAVSVCVLAALLFALFRTEQPR